MLFLLLLAVVDAATRTKREFVTIPIAKNRSGDFHQMVASDRRRSQEIAYRLGKRQNEPLETTELYGYWYATVQVGTPAQNLDLLVDTGSTPIWSSKYNPGASSTSKYTGQTLDVQYVGADGATGPIYNDTISIAGLAATQPIARSTEPFDTPQGTDTSGWVRYVLADVEFSAWHGPTRPAMDNQPALPLSAAGVIQQATFGMKLSASESELYIGGIDSSKIYGGALSYIPVVPLPGEPLIYWSVEFNSLTIGATSIPLPYQFAIIDSGTTIIYGPDNAVAAVYAAIPLSMYQQGTYIVPCFFPDSRDPRGVLMTFNLGGQTFTYPYSSLVFEGDSDMQYNEMEYCYGQIQPDPNNAELWTLGDGFMVSYYVQFDYDNQRVGIGYLA